MQITGKFKDYYDGAVSYGFDPDLNFIRTTKEIEMEGNKLPIEIQKIFNLVNGGDIPLHFIFFCGKVYLVVKLKNTEGTFGTIQDYIENIETRVRENKDSQDDRSFMKGDELNWGGKVFAHSAKGLLALEKKLSEIKIPDKLFIDLNVPYFVTTRNSWYSKNNVTITLLPKLSKYSFFKFLDTFTCYQEIRMYLGNVLTKLDMGYITTGGDKIIAQSKGFDDMSFRTMAPGKKKENRKINRERKKKNPQ
jgi:hypothetical protein